MRDTIINAVHRRMATDKRVFFLCADVGINLVEKIRDSYPERFLNVGIAEANLIGVAAGLCASGYRPVCYTFSQFITQRCFEQIRDDIVLHDYPLVLLGYTTGFDNCQLGPTHHVVDDWGTVRNLPGMEVHCPCSVAYAEGVIDDVMDRNVTAYVRIPKGGSISVKEKTGWWSYVIGTSDRTLLVSYGGQAKSCLEAQEINPAFSTLIVNRLRPLRTTNCLISHARIVVVEDHFAESGLWSTICQVMAIRSTHRDLYSRAPDRYYREVGDTPEHFWKKYRGDVQSLLDDFS